MRKQWTIVALLIIAVLMAACGNVSNDEDGGTPEEAADNKGQQEQQTGSTLDEARERGYITVGFANEAPYAYMEADGTLTGEAVEIARVILNKLGIADMRGEMTEFSGLISGLEAGRFDMITAGMFINSDRCQQVLFADPEYSIGEAIAVKQGNPMDIHSYEDIAESGAKVAVMTGAVEIGYLEASGVSEQQMVIVPDQNAAISALQAGRADVITMTGPALQSRLEAAADDELERVSTFEQPVVDGQSVRGYGASAFRQADTAFVQAFNEELRKLKEDDGLLPILERFGFTADELPGEATAEELCG